MGKTNDDGLGEIKGLLVDGHDSACEEEVNILDEVSFVVDILASSEITETKTHVELFKNRKIRYLREIR